MTVDRSPVGTDQPEWDVTFADRVALAAGASLEREELIRLLFVEVKRVLRCQSFGFFCREPGGSFVVVSASGSDNVEQVRVEGGADLYEGAPQAFCSPDNSSSSHPVLRWFAGRGLFSSLCVPVMVAQQLLSWLVVSRSRRDTFTPGELRPLVQIAHLVAPALNSIHLYERLEAAHKELAAAKDELGRSARLTVQGELASGVAHDLNNILGLIAARADLLSAHNLPTEVLASVEAIGQAVDDGITVVRRMTQFARKQRSRELVALDVSRVVEDALEMTRPRWEQGPQAAGSRTQVRFKPSGALTVVGIPSELREVMVNLVMNSVDAMPKGGDIDIDICREEDWAVISVSDTGCGMVEEVCQQIFEPFFTTKGEAGSGLGLWVSNGIVARHGGDIQVRSELGKGSCFRVRLPLATSASTRPGRKGADQSRSILVVDDEAGLGEALKLSLEIVGYKVDCSSEPRRALEMFKSRSFDLVITDLRMPVMSGWELAAEIKRFSPQTPILAMTGWPVDLMRDGQKGSCLEAIIQKPYRVNDLRTKVAKLLAERYGNQ